MFVSKLYLWEHVLGYRTPLSRLHNIKGIYFILTNMLRNLLYRASCTSLMQLHAQVHIFDAHFLHEGEFKYMH